MNKVSHTNNTTTFTTKNNTTITVLLQTGSDTRRGNGHPVTFENNVFRNAK